MKSAEILGRIDSQMLRLQINDTELSRRAGRPDVVKNIRAKVRQGADYELKTNTLVDIARALDVSLDWLVNGVGVPSGSPGAAAQNGKRPDLDYIFSLVAGSYRVLAPWLSPEDAEAAAALLRGIASKPRSDFGFGAPDLEAKILASHEVQRFLDETRKPQNPSSRKTSEND